MRTRSGRIGVCLSLFLGFAALTTLPGCGKSAGEVSGKVTYKGTLLKGGTVTFFGAAGEPSSSASIDENGNYKIPKLYAGDYQVCVETASLIPGGASKAGGQMSMPPSGMMPPGMASKMPPTGANTSKAITPPKDAYSKVTAGKDGHAPGSEYKTVDPSESAKRYMSIPTVYAKQETTTLKYTYSGGQETYNIDLK